MNLLMPYGRICSVESYVWLAAEKYLFSLLVIFLLSHLTSLITSVWYLFLKSSGTLSDVSDRSLLDARV